MYLYEQSNRIAMVPVKIVLHYLQKRWQYLEAIERHTLIAKDGQGEEEFFFVGVYCADDFYLTYKVK